MHLSLRFILTQSGKFLMLFFFLTVSACNKSEQPGNRSDATAKVSNAVKESELTTVILSPKADERLGIETSLVEYRNIRDTLRVGGEIVSPPGHDVMIAAPMAGTVFGINRDELVTAGTQVKTGQPILNLLLLTPETDLAGAHEAIEVKKIQFDVAQANANRAKQLLLDKATSEKIYLEAQAGLAAAKASLKAAEARLHLLNGTGVESSQEGISTFILKSPVDGVIQRIFVAPGQAVSASTILFEVARLDPVWIRVPVYVGEIVTIDRQKEAIILPLGTVSDKTVYKAKPLEGPLLSDPISVSSDLFFQISNPDWIFRIGQKVSVLLTKLGSGERMVASWSAVIYDIHGGSWVYVKSGPNTYSRRRIEISNMIDGFAVLTRGLKRGDEIVTKGAAEIFGIEFGDGK